MGANNNMGRWNSDTFGGNNKQPGQGGPPSKPTWENSGQ